MFLQLLLLLLLVMVLSSEKFGSSSPPHAIMAGISLGKNVCRTMDLYPADRAAFLDFKFRYVYALEKIVYCICTTIHGT